MKNLKNILIINDFDYIQGGASKVAIDTANILCDDYTVYFFSGDSKDTNSLDARVIKICTNQGESIKNKNKMIGALNGIYNFKARKELKKLLKTLNKEETIVHVHGWTKCLSSSIFDVCWESGFKVVLTLHDYFTACPNGGYFNYKKNEICHINPLSIKCAKCNCDSRNYFFKIYRIIRQFVQNKIVKLNDRLTDVITISEFSENILKNTLGTNVELHRVYNPVDLDEQFYKVDYEHNKYYLYVGRVSKEKGVDIFCKAISELNLRGIVVGDGEEKQRLQNQYSNIEFVGWKKSNEVKEYMKKAKALIFPSLWYEGAPLTPLEAMQYELPVFTSSCNAAIDYYKDFNSSFIYENVNDLMNKISQFESRKIKYVESKKILNAYLNYKEQIRTCYINIITKKGE